MGKTGKGYKSSEAYSYKFLLKMRKSDRARLERLALEDDLDYSEELRQGLYALELMGKDAREALFKRRNGK